MEKSSTLTGHHHDQRADLSYLRQQRRTQERGTDIICRVKYGNSLPDLPFEPKFLQSPFISLNRFINYNPTTLEKNFKYELLTEPDLNVKIDLIDPMTYICDPVEKSPLDPIDEQLLEDESISQLNTRRSVQHRKVVPWMRKTEYISTEFSRYGIGQTGADRPDTKIGYGTKKRIKSEPFEYKNRDAQITAIQRTFADIEKPITHHYNKPGVTAVEEFPIFPDFDLWKYPFAQVIFDANPLPYCKEHREHKLAEAILRGMADSEGNQFVGYFAPLDEALEQRMVDDQEEFGSYKDGIEYHYKLEREYNWSVQNKATKGYEQENYFLIRRGNAFFYNELDTKVKLTRRPKGVSTVKNTILAVTNRQTTAKELLAMSNRSNQLFGIQEEEDNEIKEEEDHEEEACKAMGDPGENSEDEMEEENEEYKQKRPDKDENESVRVRNLQSTSPSSDKEEESDEENDGQIKNENDTIESANREVIMNTNSQKTSDEEEEETSSDESEEESSVEEEED